MTHRIYLDLVDGVYLMLVDEAEREERSIPKQAARILRQYFEVNKSESVIETGNNRNEDEFARSFRESQKYDR